MPTSIYRYVTVTTQTSSQTGDLKEPKRAQ
jgi:hypothetical protein